VNVVKSGPAFGASILQPGRESGHGGRGNGDPFLLRAALAFDAQPLFGQVEIAGVEAGDFGASERDVI
jgi:hypothetical protein